MTKELVYLACPYSHKLYYWRNLRFQAVNRAAARLMADGILVFSPISHTHPIAEAGGLPKDWAFWERYDRAILACCAKVIVLRMPGWEESKGVQAEILIAEEMGIPVEYMDSPVVVPGPPQGRTIGQGRPEETILTCDQ